MKVRRRKRTRRRKKKEASKAYLPRRLKNMFFFEILLEIVKQLRPKKSDFEHTRKEKEKKERKEKRKKVPKRQNWTT